MIVKLSANHNTHNFMPTPSQFTSFPGLKRSHYYAHHTEPPSSFIPTTNRDTRDTCHQTPQTMADPEPSERPAALASQLDELSTHLDALLALDDPSQSFEAELFDRISYQLGPVSYPDLTARFLPRLGAILKKTAALADGPAASSSFKGYPPPLLTLTIKLLRPLPFTTALELCPAPYLITALASSEEYINALALAILTKATAAPSDASILAATPLLLEALLERWLLSPSVTIGQQGVLLLGDLLDIDCPLSQPLFTDAQKDCLDLRLVARRAQGHGAVWRRLFGPDSTNSLAWALLQRLDTTLLPADSADPLVRHQRSLAQDRLLRLLPRLAVLDFRALTACVAALPPSPQQPVSLLEFATLHMVDRANDELLRLTWTDYVMKLVGALRVADTARLSVEEVRRLVREARDPELVEALWSMPGNLVWTPEGEEEAVREWLKQVAPRAAPRIANGAS